MLCHVAHGLLPHFLCILFAGQLAGVSPDSALLLPIIPNLNFLLNLLPSYLPVSFLLTNESSTCSWCREGLFQSSSPSFLTYSNTLVMVLLHKGVKPAQSLASS